jgi:hypothetical protein
MNATDLIDAVGADRAVKAKHRAMWALGDYPAVATEIIPDLGPIMVEACGVRPGDRVLDVAAGSGNAAIPAALAGGSVVARERSETFTWRADDPGARGSGKRPAARPTHRANARRQPGRPSLHSAPRGLSRRTR